MSLMEWMQEAGWPMTGEQSSLLFATLLLTIALWLLLPSRNSARLDRRILGGLAGLAGLGILWSFMAQLSLTVQAAFYAMATITIACAVATISSRSPVHSAIWFAASLLGVAGLFLFQGAQFLGVATVAVYAGAIVVTFLFVLMLAQAGGHAFFDRMSWGSWPRYVASIAAVCLLVVIAVSLTEIDGAPYQAVRVEIGSALAKIDSASELRAVRLERKASDECEVRVRVAASRDSQERLLSNVAAIEQAAADVLANDEQIKVSLEFVDVLSPNHVAHFGGRLFGRHLIAIQVAAALLLAALVGAIAIASRDSELQRANGEST